MIVLDRLPLAAGVALLVLGDPEGGDPRPVPWLVDGERRAMPGEHAAEALVRLLEGGTRTVGRFAITAWQGASLVGERSFGVDQTNESVVVGERAVVKWMRTAEPGPHPAPPMLTALMEHGFAGTTQPWGTVEWQGVGDPAPRLLASVDTLLPGAVDGWTWAVDDVRTAVTSGSTEAVELSGDRLGVLVADLHAALAATGRPATDTDVAAWTAGAIADLDRALEATSGAARELLAGRAEEVRRRVVPPGDLVGSPLIMVHGDLHVGQVLRAGATFVVTDFDGNPVVPPGERTTPQPAALDVAGMAQSITHAAYVLRRHEPDHPAATVRAVSAVFVDSFLASYVARLAALGASRLFEPALVPGFRLRQVCREFTYAAVHLPRWSYVPEAAVVDLVPDPEAA
ncbi:MAG: phosphotransferase [Nocardioides sp.]